MILEDDLICFGACAAEGSILTSCPAGHAFCYGLCPGEALGAGTALSGHGSAA